MADIALDLIVLAAASVLLWRGAFMRAEVVPLVRLRNEFRKEWGEERSGGPGWTARVTARLEDFRDLRRVLIVAGLPDSPTEWVLRTVGLAVILLGLCALLDGALYPSMHDLLVPVWASLLVAGLAVPLRVLRVVQRVRARRLEASRALGAMFKLFQVMGRRPIRHHAVLDPGDPLVILARCRRTPVLLEMLTDARWQSLVVQPTTTWEWFQAFAEVYGVAEADQHATVLRNASEGSEAAQAEEYGREAKAWSAKWRADMTSVVASRSVRRLVPLTMLLLPMLIIIFSSLVGSWTT